MLLATPLPQKITDKVRLAIKTRLEMQVRFLPHWSRAMALGAMPSNAPNTLHQIALMVDDIWHLAGDNSTDVCSSVLMRFM